jgi:hypothetical protein
VTVWIKIDGDIDRIWQPIFVERQEATVLSSADAHQVIRKLDNDYGQCKWEAVPAPEGSDQRVIKGEDKVPKN